MSVHSFVRRNQEISVVIEVIPTHKSWLFTSIYASNKVHLRNEMWSNLINLQNKFFSGPWLVGGDFNNVLNSSEKVGGNNMNRNRTRHLWDCINKCGLIDLGFKGSKYTWSNHRRKNKGLIMERLDKVFANSD